MSANDPIYGLIAATLPDNVHIVDPLDVHQQFKNHDIPTVNEAFKKICNSPAITSTQDLGDPLDAKLYKYLTQIKAKTLQLIDKMNLDYEREMANLKKNKFKNQPHPDYGQYIALAKMMEELQISEFQGFVQVQTTRREQMIERCEKLLLSNHNLLKQQSKHTQDKVRDLYEKFRLDIKQKHQIQAQLEEGTFCLRIKREQNKEYNWEDNLDGAIQDIQEHPENWPLHEYLDHNSSEGKWCQGSKCKHCGHTDDLYNETHNQRNGHCRGEKCKVCHHESQSFRDNHDMSVKGDCSGKKCSYCPYKEDGYRTEHQYEKAACRGERCIRCLTKKGDYSNKHDHTVVAQCRGAKCKHCGAKSNDYSDEHEPKSAVCQGHYCLYCSKWKSQNYKEAHNFTPSECKGKKCSNCGTKVDGYKEKHEFTTKGYCSGTKCQNCPKVTANYRDQHDWTPGKCSGQQCKFCNKKENFHDKHSLLRGECAGSKCSACSFNDGYKDQCDNVNSQCKGSICNRCEHKSNDYQKFHAYKLQNNVDGKGHNAMVCQYCKIYTITNDEKQRVKAIKDAQAEAERKKNAEIEAQRKREIYKGLNTDQGMSLARKHGDNYYFQVIVVNNGTSAVKLVDIYYNTNYVTSNKEDTVQPLNCERWGGMCNASCHFAYKGSKYFLSFSNPYSGAVKVFLTQNYQYSMHNHYDSMDGWWPGNTGNVKLTASNGKKLYAILQFE